MTGLRAVAENSEDVQMGKWHFYFVDERHVPLASDQSNYNTLASQLLLKVSVRVMRLLWHFKLVSG